MRVLIDTGGHYAAEPCVATVGFFDGVHRGHRFLIEQVTGEAARTGIQSTIVTFDRHPATVVRRGSVPKMLCTFEEKLRLLASTGVDNCVVLPFDEALSSLSAETFMRAVLRDRYGVRTLVAGYDNRFGKGRREGFEDYVRYGREMGMSVLLAKPLPVSGRDISSSAIREALAAGDVETAAQGIGRPYSIEGTVVGGERIGRHIGFPTANISPREDIMLPAGGAYAVRVRVSDGGTTLPGMMNIGCRPTFGGKKETLEVHILRFSGDIYGRQVTVFFERYLRPERRFDSAEALAAQLRKDAAAAEETLRAKDM